MPQWYSSTDLQNFLVETLSSLNQICGGARLCVREEAGLQGGFNGV